MLDAMRLLAHALLVGTLAGPDDGCLGAFDPAPPADAERRAAHELWIRDCADCHGIGGAVDGSKSASLTPRPPDFSDPCRPMTDEWIARVILDGGASFNGNAEMRPHHELAAKPEVLDALVELVREFRGTGACKPGTRKPGADPDDAD